MCAWLCSVNRPDDDDMMVDAPRSLVPEGSVPTFNKNMRSGTLEKGRKAASPAAKLNNDTFNDENVVTAPLFESSSPWGRS